MTSVEALNDRLTTSAASYYSTSTSSTFDPSPRSFFDPSLTNEPSATSYYATSPTSYEPSTDYNASFSYNPSSFEPSLAYNPYSSINPPPYEPSLSHPSSTSYYDSSTSPSTSDPSPSSTSSTSFCSTIPLHLYHPRTLRQIKRRHSERRASRVTFDVVASCIHEHEEHEGWHDDSYWSEACRLAKGGN